MTNRTRVIVAGITVCAVLFAVPALAVDGEILINQAKVNAGGITPGDAPGFPATLTKSGRYKLSGNLKVPADKYGIVVTRPDVTIDLNGFTISSNPLGRAFFGIHGPDVASLRVVNGTITGVAHAIRGGAFAMVENVRLVSNWTGVVVGHQARIRNSTIAGGLAGHGISCGQGCLVEQNVIRGNSGNGITLSGGGVVLGNMIVDNGGFGLGSDFPLSGYGNNILFGNNGGGAQVAETDPSEFHPNYCEPACP